MCGGALIFLLLFFHKLTLVRCEDNAQIATSFRSYATAKSEKVLQVRK